MSTFKANLIDNSEYYSIRRMGMIVGIIAIAIYGFLSGMLPHFQLNKFSVLFGVFATAVMLVALRYSVAFQRWPPISPTTAKFAEVGMQKKTAGMTKTSSCKLPPDTWYTSRSSTSTTVF